MYVFVTKNAVFAGFASRITIRTSNKWQRVTLECGNYFLLFA